jgi:DNA-binding transcriptional regulator YiaG
MNGFFLKHEVDRRLSEQLEKIIHSRAKLVEQYSRLIEALDASDAHQWRQIVAAAREGGLSKEVLCEAFSCSWSTILRWEAGRNAPGSFARKAMKATLIDLLAERHKAELNREQQLVSGRAKVKAA